jgi:hypothetical protein
VARGFVVLATDVKKKKGKKKIWKDEQIQSNARPSANHALADKAPLVARSSK